MSLPKKLAGVKGIDLVLQSNGEIFASYNPENMMCLQTVFNDWEQVSETCDCKLVLYPEASFFAPAEFVNINDARIQLAEYLRT